MKSAFNRSILALTAILVVAVASQANAQQKPLKKYESGTKEFWTHPPDDWFLGDETEAQKGLAPPSGPPTGSSDAELATLMKKIKLPAGFKIEVYASNVLAARQMACRFLAFARSLRRQKPRSRRRRRGLTCACSDTRPARFTPPATKSTSTSSASRRSKTSTSPR